MSILTLPARKSRRAKRGATALEYALVLAFVAVAVLGALTTLGTNLTDTIGTVGGKVTDAADADFS
ncbi:MAG: Flp family type IVb pilin [Sandaracinobacteroides sp.]